MERRLAILPSTRTGSLAGEAGSVARDRQPEHRTVALSLPSLAAEASRLVEAETEPLRRSAWTDRYAIVARIVTVSPSMDRPTRIPAARATMPA